MLLHLLPLNAPSLSKFTHIIFLEWNDRFNINYLLRPPASVHTFCGSLNSFKALSLIARLCIWCKCNCWLHLRVQCHKLISEALSSCYPMYHSLSQSLVYITDLKNNHQRIFQLWCNCRWYHSPLHHYHYLVQCLWLFGNEIVFA